MSARPRSAVLITVDSLRFDRLGIGGGARWSSPTLDAMAGEARWFPRAYANSWYTQFSFPSILSSTMPLDFGGYDLGIAARPSTVADAFRQRGYRTLALSTDPYLNAYYGYERGFDEFLELFDFSALWQHVCRDYAAHYAREVTAGERTRDAVHALLHPPLGRLLRYAVGYYERKLAPVERALGGGRSPLYQQDFRASLAAAHRDLTALTREPSAYIDALLRFAGGQDGAPSSPVLGTDPKAPLWQRLATTLGAFPAKRQQSLVDAREVVALAESWMGRQGGAPFFAWIALNDVHDLNFCHRWYSRDTRRFQRDARRDGDSLLMRESHAVRFVDDAVRRLMTGLHRHGYLDSTLVVVAADHGRSNVDAPFGGLFSDSIMRVPLMFWSRWQTPVTDPRPCSLLDIGPTMLSMLELEPDGGMRGLALGGEEAAQRPHIQSEQLGGGPCDVHRPSMRLCFVGREYKYAWSPSGDEWYNDLVARPRRGFVSPGPEVSVEQLDLLRRAARDRQAAILRGALSGASARSL